MKTEYKKLELDKILEFLSGEAWSDLVKEKARAVEPLYGIDEIKRELNKTDAAFVLSAKYGTPRFYNIKDVSFAIRRAEQGAALSLRELLDVGLVLREIDGLIAWYDSCGGEENVLHEYFAVLKPEKSLEERIENSILNEEELSDGASAELSRIRKAILRQGAKIKDQLDKLIKSETNRKFLQESLVTQRDGRYVVPVKSEYRGQVGGLVHDTSSSGATLFIEPMSVVEANNEIRILKREEQEEIERIIRELSAEVGRCGEALLLGIGNALTLELYFAKANLGAKMKGICPRISGEAVLQLNKARHPLIPSERVVPTTIALGEEYTSLIITGPNTGGKTVALKTAGLLTLMTMCGLMIPAADDSVVGVFSRLLVDIGDEQSIEQSLSTFSAHMTNIVRIMETADERSLILLDELGSGTDPVEGAALAVSVLSYFRDVGSRVMATTHYQEVKMYAIEREGVENASCEFDVATLKPTYRLVIGFPGKSNAFAIAKRLGLSEDVIREAKSLVGDENKRFERVVERLEETSRELETLRAAAERDARDAARLTEALREKEEALEKQRDFELNKARSQAMSIVEQTRSESERIMRELEDMRLEKEKADFAEKVKTSRSQTNTALNKMYDRANPVVEKKKTKYVLPRELRVGDTVRLMDIGNSGTVVSLPDSGGNCVVQVGMIKTRTKLDNLELVAEQPPSKKKQSGQSVKRSLQSNMTRKSSLELDIRGMLTDEGIMEVDRFIDSCLIGGIEQITIIHGKGTGALRAAVHQFLKQHKNVKSYRLGTYGEGEAGVTVAELK
ncbi:MAG: endonuclease MutS2 [Bacteroides sp.]|nr:endonuclease MutS2 [Eubacterium sp.]MCM1417919.1 endonuclease MutS2 [Roseburia sp.]MCM1461918.1 endonuclease MutS2 [Bacteroides sp.]